MEKDDSEKGSDLSHPVQQKEQMPQQLSARKDKPAPAHHRVDFDPDDCLGTTFIGSR